MGLTLYACFDSFRIVAAACGCWLANCDFSFFGVEGRGAEGSQEAVRLGAASLSWPAQLRDNSDTSAPAASIG